MVNTVNTDWKLTTLWNCDLSGTDGNSVFIFDSANGYNPDNENHAATIQDEPVVIAWDNISQSLDKGLGMRNITLQGTTLYSPTSLYNSVWALSSAVYSRQLMKLWTGEDWFYYVLGNECRIIRDITTPTMCNYTVSFKAMSPYQYHAYQDGGAGTEKERVYAYGVAQAFTGQSSAFALTFSTATYPTDIEPCFWIIGGASDAITAVVISDGWGGQITYTPTTTIASGHVHCIMPWRNTQFEGFIVNEITGFKCANTSEYTLPTTSTPGTWAGDLFNFGLGTNNNATSTKNNYSFITEEKSCIPARNGTSYIERNRFYPRLKVGRTTTITATATGTCTNAKFAYQYLITRV